MQPLDGHADRYFNGDLNALHLSILEMGALALNQVELALKAATTGDNEAAQKVFEREPLVDNMELDIDEKIIDLIGKRGPIAKDLRVVIAFSKIVADIERMGDEAARIAYISEKLFNNETSRPGPGQIRDVVEMGKTAVSVCEQVLTVFDSLDAEAAAGLLDYEKELDAQFESSLRHLTTYVLEDSRNIGHTISLTLILKAIGRVGAHAQNIAEYVIYLVEGVDIRHRKTNDS